MVHLCRHSTECTINPRSAQFWRWSLTLFHGMVWATTLCLIGDPADDDNDAADHPLWHQRVNLKSSNRASEMERGKEDYYCSDGASGQLD